MYRASKPILLISGRIFCLMKTVLNYYCYKTVSSTLHDKAMSNLKFNISEEGNAEI